MNFIASIASIARISDQINSISKENIKLKLGSFSLSGDKADIRQSDFKLADATPNQTEAPGSSNAEKTFLDIINKTPGHGLRPEQGLHFPIIENPKKVFDVLLGKKEVELFTYKMPPLKFEFSGNFLTIPIFPPILNAELNGSITARFGTEDEGLRFGYDTEGLYQFALGNDNQIGTDDDFGDSTRLAKGLFIQNFSGNEAELTVALEAIAEIDAYFASAKAGADIKGKIGIDLIGASNSKVRLNDFDIADLQNVFSTSAEVTAGLSASIKIPFRKRDRISTPRYVLWSTTGGGGSDGGGNLTVLATGPDAFGILQLSIGLEANKRQGVEDRKGKCPIAKEGIGVLAIQGLGYQ